MAKVYFYYSAMNAGKSTTLLQANYNYFERGMQTLLFAPEFDNRYGKVAITSRIGLQQEATSFNEHLNLNGTSFGNLCATYLLADVIFLLPAGIILDRFSVKKVILAALSCCVLG